MTATPPAATTSPPPTTATTSLTPGHFRAGPDRDAARTNRDAFRWWLRESADAAAVEYREAVAALMVAKQRKSVARRRARTLFKRAIGASG